MMPIGPIRYHRVRLFDGQVNVNGNEDAVHGIEHGAVKEYMLSFRPLPGWDPSPWGLGSRMTHSHRRKEEPVIGIRSLGLISVT